jgi:hypothetical protein
MPFDPQSLWRTSRIDAGSAIGSIVKLSVPIGRLCCGQRAHAVRVRPMAAETGDQRITAGLQLRLRERVLGSTEQGRHFDGR